jgi:methylisocitrate lyase
MQLRVRSAVRARRDPDLLVVARTDAGPSEGVDRAIERAKAYQDSGADVIFPDAFASLMDYEKLARALDVPILVNMAEFSKSPLLTAGELESAGARIVIYPGTTLRLALHAVDAGLGALHHEGTQKELLDRMMPRARFKDIVNDADYVAFDNAVGK